MLFRSLPMLFMQEQTVVTEVQALGMCIVLLFKAKAPICVFPTGIIPTMVSVAIVTDMVIQDSGV